MATLTRLSRPALLGVQVTCVRSGSARLLSAVTRRCQVICSLSQATYTLQRDVSTSAGNKRSTVPLAKDEPVASALPRAERAVENRALSTVDLVWSSGELTSFPFVWLRDSCCCSSCYHVSSRQRLFPIAALDIDIAPASILNDTEGKRLQVTWSDGHQSQFPHEWLADHAFTNQQLQKRGRRLRPLKSALWDRKIGEQSLLKVDYHQFLEELPVLYQALRQLQTYGVMVVTGSTKQFGVVEQICDRLGRTRTTHYGKTFRVSNKVGANNLAYTTEGLELHLDLPYYNHIPGFQVLHCISQHKGTGGDNILADSFYAAEQIRKQRPDLFHLLTTRPIEFHDIGYEDNTDTHFHKMQEHTMFKMNEDGDVFQVCFNNHCRSYRLPVDLAFVRPVYEGMKMFHDLCMQEENHMLYKMDDGDVLVFNNVRVMHGRLGYSVTEESERVLEGGYCDWDELMCRYRVVGDILNSQHHTY